MLDLSQILAFGLICLAMVLTPGPNMIYLISRSISQGKIAGFISLGGVALGVVFYMLCASFAYFQCKRLIYRLTIKIIFNGLFDKFT